MGGNTAERLPTPSLVNVDLMLQIGDLETKGKLFELSSFKRKDFCNNVPFWLQLGILQLCVSLEQISPLGGIVFAVLGFQT